MSKIIEDALEVGYRLIDTALYKNEEAVGQAIKASGIKREIFSSQQKRGLTSSYDETKKHLKQVLKTRNRLS